uniref:Protein MAK16 homolog n=1 Tax=Mesocestoides corti TaxID=53468 RepID=A0A5K3FTC3_MESCO
MNSDDLIWQLISKSFCSFMVKTKTGKFCRNEDNVTGLCNRHSCPLSNSQYATIKERDGIIYLYVKAPERVPYPIKQWERIKLKKNEEQAIEQINEHLRYWDRWIRTRVKLRFLRTRDYLKRMRRLALSRQKKIETINRKVERRELRREEKALRVAKLSRTVEKELLERIRVATSSKEIYNIDQSAFEKALETEELEEEEEEEEIVYTSGSDLEEEEEIEDFADAMQVDEEEPALVTVEAGTSSSDNRKVRIRFENDEES